MTHPVLDLPMQDNDADAKTIRDYLKALLTTLMYEGESFSGKRPFGNSGWDWDLHKPLVLAGLVKGEVDENGDIQNHDDVAADKILLKAIKDL